MSARRLAIVVVAIVVLVAALVGLRQLARSRTVQLFGAIVPRVETTERRLALTFDDGPTSAVVDSLIAILDARGVRATFLSPGTSSRRRLARDRASSPPAMSSATTPSTTSEWFCGRRVSSARRSSAPTRSFGGPVTKARSISAHLARRSRSADR